MIRYLYKIPNHVIKNGGANILISAKNLLNERETDADFWLLEASNRLDNICCCNICLDRQIGNLHIEILGKGFDISDINKGKLCPHECVDIPYPIYYGTYGEWWRWAQFYFCSQEKYINSIVIREERIKKFNSQQEVEFEPSYRPVDLVFFEHLFYWIQLIEESALIENSVFYNLSCSYDYNKRFIFWDIQTPAGKLRAYC